MGKPRKLKSSIKALHDALISFRPAVGSPMCIQPAETHSFRDPFTGPNSIYYAPSTSSSANILHHPQNLPSAEEVISVGATTMTTSTCSNCLSSSSIAVAPAVHEDFVEAEAGAFPSAALCSDRFFFSPCTSKSITRESSFLDVGSTAMEPLRSPYSEPVETGEGEGEDDVFDVSLESEIGDATDGTANTGNIPALCRESVPIAMASKDPYRDFRSSMEEMVEAHGLRDWRGLQELLHCYLKLNETKTHKVIVLAFMDLLVQLASDGEGHNSATHSAFSTPPSTSPFLQPCISE
uniref:Transcription repressor n=1 Tax=Anthurium amnicola TaxID=1678845 RepID=A0A1D1ZJD3_9ARAE